MLCHQCPYDGKPEARVCLQCKDTADSRYQDGQSIVSLDALGGSVNRRMASPKARLSLDVGECCDDALWRMLGVLMGLCDRDRNLVFHVLKGGSLRKFGLKHGVSKQAVHDSIRGMASGHVELRFLTRSLQECKPKTRAREEGVNG